MPKTRFDRFVEEPKDPLKALIIERQLAKGISDRDLAAAFGKSYKTYWVRMKSPTDEWTLKEIKSVCKAVGISINELRLRVSYINYGG